jgi:hypothetical protein
LAVFLVLHSACALFVAAGAGVAGGYILKEKDYKIQSPIDKQNKTKETTQE